jgi:hypothetical protein
LFEKKGDGNVHLFFSFTPMAAIESRQPKALGSQTDKRVLFHVTQGSHAVLYSGRMTKREKKSFADFFLRFSF